MPLIEDKNEQIAYARAIGADEQETESADFGDLLMASLRTENTIGSFIARENGLPDSIVNDESFNPWNVMTEDEKMDSAFVDAAITADNIQEVEAVRAQSAREKKDRQLLADGGATSFFTGFVAGVVDPINFIPVGGTAYKTYRNGESILKAAVATAGVAASSTAATEAGLHLTQIERTYGESAVNVGAATLLGGFLGATPGLIKEAFNTHPKIADEINESMNPEPVLTEGKNSVLNKAQSVGAGGVDAEIQVQGKIAKALTKALGFDPLSRSLTSELNSTRILASELAENPIAMENKSGTFVADSIETRAKIKDGRYNEALEGNRAAYKAYKQNGGTLKLREFNEQVSREMRNPFTDDQFIKKAAGEWRAKLYEPLKKEMIDAKLLPEDIEVATAANYLNRVWNKEKIRSGLDSFVAKTTAWLKEQQGLNQEMTDFELENLSREIATRITSTPDGRLPYDYKIGENINKAKGGGKTGLRGPLRERSFNIPDSVIEEFLENDVELLGGRYLRALATDIELVRRFGDVNMTEEIKQLSEEWDVKIQEASRTSDKLARKLARQKDQDITDIAAMRDRLRGVWGQVDADNFWIRAGRTARDLNYLRFMGGVVASSIPDVARVVMSKGLVNTFKKGLIPLVKNMQSFKVSAAEAKKYGVGVDVLMGGRAEIIADVADYAQGGTAFERGVRSMAGAFGKINLMDRWTAGVKQLHAVVAQTDMADMMTKGKYDDRLRQLGISEADSKNIAQQLRRYGKKQDGVWVANSRDWDNQNLAEIWGGALRKESDRVIVIPGQEKPLFMSTELGKTIFQFRSFMFSSTQRMLVAGIQGQDAHYMQGLIGLTSLGMMAYAFKNWDSDRPTSDEPAVWITEGIDRSGVTGIIMEMNNTVEKMSNNNFGLRPLLGIAAPASRFASRSQAEALLGPTFGSMLSTVMKVAGGASDGDLAESDIRAIRRLLPYQNLILFRQLLDKVEQGLQ